MKAKLFSIIYKNGYTNWMLTVDIILFHMLFLVGLFAIKSLLGFILL
jgi:hypothetical protein